jgi:hypothetical protein
MAKRLHLFEITSSYDREGTNRLRAALNALRVNLGSGDSLAECFIWERDDRTDLAVQE